MKRQAINGSLKCFYITKSLCYSLWKENVLNDHFAFPEYAKSSSAPLWGISSWHHRELMEIQPGCSWPISVFWLSVRAPEPCKLYFLKGLPTSCLSLRLFVFLLFPRPFLEQFLFSNQESITNTHLGTEDGSEKWPEMSAWLLLHQLEITWCLKILFFYIGQVFSW